MKMIYGSLSVRRRFGFGEILEKPVPVGAKRQKCGLSRRAVPESPMRCTPGISDVRPQKSKKKNGDETPFFP